MLIRAISKRETSSIPTRLKPCKFDQLVDYKNKMVDIHDSIFQSMANKTVEINESYDMGGLLSLTNHSKKQGKASRFHQDLVKEREQINLLNKINKQKKGGKVVECWQTIMTEASNGCRLEKSFIKGDGMRNANECRREDWTN